MKKLIIILFASVIGINSYSQCNTTLMELAAAQSGNDALYIRDFKVKLEEGTMKKPSPVGRFQVYLNEGVQYRFNVANSADFEGRAILQLYDRSRLMGSTYHTESKTDLQLFDFICEKAGSYQVLMSFLEGKSGCAVGVMSMVLSDTMILAEKISGADQEELESLFIGIDNEINIAATNIPGGSLEVLISQGTIEGANGRYIARVDNKGIATVKVIARDKNGIVSETDSFNFRVSNIPLPYIKFGGSDGGIIQKWEIDRINHISMDYPFQVEGAPYKIIEFTISAENNTIRNEVSYNSYLTPSQKSLVQKLEAGERFTIRNIYVRGPDGATHSLKPLTFIVE